MRTETNDVVPEQTIMKVRRKKGGSNSEWPDGTPFAPKGAVGLNVEFNEPTPVEIQIQRLGDLSLQMDSAEPCPVPAAASSTRHNNQEP